MSFYGYDKLKRRRQAAVGREVTERRKGNGLFKEKNWKWWKTAINLIGKGRKR